VEIVTSRRDDVVQIPNAALRFAMPPHTLQGAPDGDGAGPAVWIRGSEGYIRRSVEVGYSNDEFSEVRADSLVPGEQVVVGYRR
jgi:multidrug efflux pump subunit AcrA (membrane-fusion protein)